MDKAYISCLRGLFKSIACCVCLVCSAAYAQQQASVAEIVSISGTVETFVTRNNTWGAATQGQLLYAGDAVRTGDSGLALILTSDGSKVRINRNSRFVLTEVASSAPWLKVAIDKGKKSLYQLFAWKRGKPAAVAIENDIRGVDIVIETATVKAGIRGTSMLLEVIPAAGGDTSIVSVLEGVVGVSALTGPRGSREVKHLEQVIAEYGKPLRLVPLTVSPKDAVQWTLFVPALLPGQQKPETKGDPNYAKAMLESTRLLQTGRLTDAKVSLIELTRQYPENSWAYQLLAIVNLAMNDKETALKRATKAVALDPHSPSAAIVLSYVYQSMFQLGKAREETERALDLEPSYVLALINLARLQFGEDDLGSAWHSLEKAKKLSPDDAEIYNLRGFILLARRKTEAAIEEFTRSVRLNARLAEPHLGLALVYMRQGYSERAFKEIATAVLLDPKRSIIRSYWGKMLHQVKRFDKALEVLEQARELDRNDPTPEYYRAIILRDLYRPGEAIQAFNNAVALNNNRAVFRSRFLLDKDLASRNINMAIVYNQLGLDAWAKNKALASIKTDYANFDGHLFYQGALFELEGRSYSAASEALLARLLQPANVNTFNNFNNYTSLFEKPSKQGTLEAGVGSDDTYGARAELFGAVPSLNLAYNLGASYEHTDGWRDINYEEAGNIAAIAKWEPTPQDGVFLSVSALDAEQGDAIFPRFEGDSPPRPEDRLDITLERFELGYHHRFGPSNSLLLYGTYFHDDNKVIQRLPDAVLDWITGDRFDLEQRIDAQEPYFLGQAHYIASFSDHQVLMGSLQRRGKSEFHNELRLIGDSQTIEQQPFENDQDIGFQSYYLQDIWGLNERFTIEAGAYYEKIDNANSFLGTDWSVDGLNPRLGLIFTPTPRDTVRLAGFRYILPFISPRLDPTDVAGIQIFRNTRVGSRNSEYAGAWERQWGNSVFTSLNLFYLDKSFKERIRLQGGEEVGRTLGGRLYGLESEYNQLLTSRIGVLGSYRYLDVDDDDDPFQSPLDNVNREEHQFRLGLRYVRPDGISARMTQTLRHIDNDNIRDNETAAITDLALAYQFGQRRGQATVEILNLFDQDFNWVTDRFVLQGRAPTRQLLFTLSFNL